jgi:hypothetical protein
MKQQTVEQHYVRLKRVAPIASQTSKASLPLKVPIRSVFLRDDRL